MEEGEYYIIWYKDDNGQSRHRGIRFLRHTDVDVEYVNTLTNKKESIFIGTFRKYRGRSKHFEDLYSLQAELSKIRSKKENGKNNNNRFSYN